MIPFPIILSAPSGGGKTSIARRLLDERKDVGYSISCTTRLRRENEIDGRDYYFLSEKDFRDRQARGHFAEWAVVHGKMYGTLRGEVARVVESGRHVVMDIDVQGAMQFRSVFPDSVLVFILPPSGETLLERLRERDTENSESLLARMRSALDELRFVAEYGYVVVNDQLEATVKRVSSIIDAEALRHSRQRTLEYDVRSIAERLEQEVKSLQLRE